MPGRRSSHRGHRRRECLRRSGQSRGGFTLAEDLLGLLLVSIAILSVIAVLPEPPPSW